LKICDKEYNHNSDKYDNISIYSAPRKDDPEVIRLLTKYLREKTGSGIMNCKKTLIQNDLDIEKAIKALLLIRNTL